MYLIGEAIADTNTDCSSLLWQGQFEDRTRGHNIKDPLQDNDLDAVL